MGLINHDRGLPIGFLVRGRASNQQAHYMIIRQIKVMGSQIKVMGSEDLVNFDDDDCGYG